MSASETAFGLPSRTLTQIKAVFALHPAVERVVLYGSRAKGTFRAGSDIDLTVFGRLSWRESQEIEQQLDDLLLPYKIDLSLYEHIENQALREHIQRVGEVIYPKLRQ